VKIPQNPVLRIRSAGAGHCVRSWSSK